MSKPKRSPKNTPAFYGAAVSFFAITLVFNLINLWLLPISVQDRYMIGMGLLSSVFAVVVVSKVVRDRQEESDFIAELRDAQYEQVLAHSPAPGLGQI